MEKSAVHSSLCTCLGRDTVTKLHLVLMRFLLCQCFPIRLHVHVLGCHTELGGIFRAVEALARLDRQSGRHRPGGVAEDPSRVVPLKRL